MDKGSFICAVEKIIARKNKAILTKRAQNMFELFLTEKPMLRMLEPHLQLFTDQKYTKLQDFCVDNFKDEFSFMTACQLIESVYNMLFSGIVNGSDDEIFMEGFK